MQHADQTTNSLFSDNFNCAEHKTNVEKFVGKDGIAPVVNYQGILTHSCSGISIPLPNWLAKLKIRLTRENDNVILFGSVIRYRQQFEIVLLENDRPMDGHTDWN